MESSLVLVREQAEQSQETLYQRLLSFLYRMAKLWIHIENEPRSEKFCVARGNPELNEIDLNDISPQLCAIETLKNVQPSKLDFFRYADRITPLPLDTLINTLNTTGTDPLVVRYPFSSSQGNFRSILLHLYISCSCFSSVCSCCSLQFIHIMVQRNLSTQQWSLVPYM
jgi:hypothetical protein